MTLVFFLPVILRDQHRRIYELDRLKSEGYNIIILDATKYYNIYKRTAKDDFILKHIRECETKDDFIKFRDGLESEPVIYITNELYMKMASEVLDILVRKQDKLLAASTRFTPGHFQYPKGIKGIADRLIRTADKFLPMHFMKPIYTKRNIYVPDYFLGSTEYLNPLKTVLSVERKNRLFVHTDDVNQAFQPHKQYIEPHKKVGVFLDQMIPYFQGRNPDIHNKEKDKEYKISYYKHLVRNLKKIQETFELDEIVIALHPESEVIREEIDQKFHPFKTYVGATMDLVRDSALVLGHFSTALGMAAYYKKPMLLLADERMMTKSKAPHFVKSYMEELDLELLYIDDENAKVSKDLVHYNEKTYNRYVKKFLKQNDYKGNAYHYAINRIKEDIQGQVTA